MDKIYKTALLFVLSLTGFETLAAHPETITADTTIVVNEVQVTAIKQGLVLRSEPTASTTFGEQLIRRKHINALKNLSQSVPNLHIPDYGSRMTSSIYVRGLGARIDQPVVGLNVDNVPVMNKNNYDTELADVERIEVLRGPQSTLYGRNTMGGVINVYTLSPLTYQGSRFTAEYSSGDSYRLRASTYHKTRDNLGIAISGFYTRTGGFFTNLHTGRRCDHEQMDGGRWRTQWQNNSGLKIDNFLSFSILRQGGYPYTYIGKDIIENDLPVIRTGEIRYNDPASYERTTLSDGLTLRYDADRYTLSSITAYQYSDDEMNLDQDFLPLSYFTLRQSQREHTVSQDLVIRSRDTRRYDWLFGLFGFYRHNNMEAPVRFKRTGIDRLIFHYANLNPVGITFAWDEKAAPGYELPLDTDFRIGSYGAALYHESKLRLGRWTLSAGIRIDLERQQLKYTSHTDMYYTMTLRGMPRPLPVHLEIDDSDTFRHTYTEVLPKFTALYAFDSQRNLYASISRGYKAGGFNTQMFSDILQEQLKAQMSHRPYTPTDIVSYAPEYSWNYEVGGHFACLDGAVRGDFSLFYIDVSDLQLTVFPQGQTTGRMMTNAGKARSYGVETSVMVSPRHNLDFNCTYGYTNAKFKHYIDGKNDYKGNHIPYSPTHTLSLTGAWSIPTGVEWLGDVVLGAGMQSTGDIWWNEANTLREPFYTLWNASLRIEHPRYSIDFWGRNLGDRRYGLFYFKSMGNEFMQYGRPRTFGVTVSVNI